MTTAIPRVTARIDLNTQDLLARAAAISGISSINSFVLNAAVEKANFGRSPRQSGRRLMRVPAILHTKLKAAFARYDEQANNANSPAG